MNFGLRDAVYDAAYDENEELHRARYMAGFWENKYIHIYDDDIIAGDVLAGTLYPYNVYRIGDNNDVRALLINGKINKDEAHNFINAAHMGLICRNPGVHTTASYSDMVKHGISPRIRYVEEKLKDEPESIFYKSEFEVLQGFKKLILRYADEAKNLWSKTGNDNLRTIAENCRRIAEDSPKTFLQGLQLVLFIDMGIVMENGGGSFSFGRLDQYLYPLYKRDIDEGRINRLQAQEYLDAFWGKLAEMGSSWQNVTIGGARNGTDECNDLTIMCMEAAKRVKGQQPQLSLRVHKNMKTEVWDKAIDLISCGMGFPSMFNDDVCIKAMKSKGTSNEDAENYSVMGCVELLTEGKEFSHQEGMRFNFVKFLELLLHGGGCALTGKTWRLKEVRDLNEINDFNDFYNWYKDELKDTMMRLCNMLDITSGRYGKRHHSAFLSAVMDGPLENERDIHDNGTKYNNLTICGVGTGEIADCLQAIQEVCFEKRTVTLSDLVRKMDENYAENEDTRKQLLDCKKYGNDFDEVDIKCREIVELFTKTVIEYKPKYRNGVIQVGFYTSYFHSDFGKYTAASPDGRKAGVPLSPSLSPMAGMDNNGLLAVINSANKIDMSKFANCMALDIKLAPAFFDKDENRTALKDVIITYFENGGEEIQINVIDADTLRKAKADPIRYSNIIVRVAGFSAKFVDLNCSLQDEIIRRTEHIVA